MVLFTIVKIWNQPRRPSSDERKKRICYIYTLNAHIEHSEIDSCSIIWKLNTFLNTFGELWIRSFLLVTYMQYLWCMSVWFLCLSFKASLSSQSLSGHFPVPILLHIAPHSEVGRFNSIFLTCPTMVHKALFITSLVSSVWTQHLALYGKMKILAQKHKMLSFQSLALNQNWGNRRQAQVNIIWVVRKKEATAKLKFQWNVSTTVL